MLSTSEIEQKSADALRKVDVAFRRTAIEFRRGDQGLEVWWAPGKEFDATQLGNYSDARVVGVSKKVTTMLFDSCDLMNDSERVDTCDYVVEIDLVIEREWADTVFQFSETEPLLFRMDASDMWDMSQGRVMASIFEMQQYHDTGAWSWFVEIMDLSDRIGECVSMEYQTFPVLWNCLNR